MTFGARQDAGAVSWRGGGVDSPVNLSSRQEYFRVKSEFKLLSIIDFQINSTLKNKHKVDPREHFEAIHV